ncbi:hypothetical protein EC968_008269 [Mortierella alpina]|nr:hypothetical protein EC968_008269 [Mortierella alpina]
MQDPDILSRHPRLHRLITDLNARFLTPTGSSLPTNQALYQAKYNLKHKKEYLETKALFEPIERLRFLPLDSHHHPSHAKDTLEANRTADLQKQVSHHIDRILSILDARRLVVLGAASSEASSTTDTTNTMSMIELLAGHDSHQDLDGFTLEHLQTHLEALEGFSQPMYRTIEDTLSARAIDIVTLHTNTTTLPDTAPATVAAALDRVLSDTREKVRSLDRIEEDTLLLDLAIQQEIRSLFDTLQKTILVLWEIVLEFRIRHQFEQNTTFQEYFSSLAESIVLKLDDALETKERQLQLQTTQNATLLRQYQTAGPEFNMIVDAYADLMQRIDIVEDDIRRLG